MIFTGCSTVLETAYSSAPAVYGVRRPAEGPDENFRLLEEKSPSGFYVYENARVELNFPEMPAVKMQPDASPVITPVDHSWFEAVESENELVIRYASDTDPVFYRFTIPGFILSFIPFVSVIGLIFCLISFDKIE